MIKNRRCRRKKAYFIGQEAQMDMENNKKIRSDLFICWDNYFELYIMQLGVLKK